MAKSLQSQFRDIERNLVRETNKMVKRANKKIKPVNSYCLISMQVGHVYFLFPNSRRISETFRP